MWIWNTTSTWAWLVNNWNRISIATTSQDNYYISEKTSSFVYIVIKININYRKIFCAAEYLFLFSVKGLITIMQQIWLKFPSFEGLSYRHEYLYYLEYCIKCVLHRNIVLHNLRDRIIKLTTKWFIYYE